MKKRNDFLKERKKWEKERKKSGKNNSGSIQALAAQQQKLMMTNASSNSTSSSDVNSNASASNSIPALKPVSSGGTRFAPSMTQLQTYNDLHPVAMIGGSLKDVRIGGGVAGFGGNNLASLRGAGSDSVS